MVRHPSEEVAPGSGETPLAVRLKNRIRAHGAISVRDYMDACLADPDYGYYRKEAAVGAAHDFVTAPEISQIFGELIGLWAAFTWQRLGSPDRIAVIELGPGRGTLMSDLLRASQIVPGFHTALELHLVETNERLRRDQESRLGDQAVARYWHHTVGGLGEHLANSEMAQIIVANEFLDAIPATQLIMTEDGLCERGVGLNDAGEFCFVTLPGPAAVEGQVDHIREVSLRPGDVFEVQGFSLLRDLFGIGQSHAPVAAVMIDYGHDQSLAGDTLQAVRHHQTVSPFSSPGEADLTAHVDFSAAKRAAIGAGFTVDGPITQAEFLGHLGIMERASRLMSANPAKASDVEAGVARLMSPQGMGGRFKVLGLRRGLAEQLAGF